MFIFFMALYFIANTMCRLLIRVFTQKTKLDAYSASFAITISTYIVGLAYGLLRQEQPLLQGFTPMVALSVFGVGVMQVFAGKIAVVTQKHIETAQYSVIRMLQVPSSVVISTLFLGEALTLMQTVGMLSILAGVSIVSTGGKIPRLMHFGRYELLTIANSAFLGVYTVFNRYLIEQTSLSTLMVVWAGIEMIPLLATIVKRPTQMPVKSDIVLALGIGATAVLNIVAFWLAVAIAGNVALVSSLSAFRVVVIFAGSYLILKEKNNLTPKIIGSLLAVVGLLLG